MAIKNSVNSSIPLPVSDIDMSSATDGHTIVASGGVATIQAPAEGGEQFIFQTLTTTDAAESTVLAIEIPDDKAITFTVHLSAKGPSDKHYWSVISGGARKNAGENASLVGTASKTFDDENSPGYLSDVDISGSQLRVRVTGASSETVVWDAKILYNSDAAGEDLVSSKTILSFSTTTTDATESTLGLFELPDESNVAVWALVSAHKDDLASDKNYWAIAEFSARRNNAGSAVIVGDPSIREDDEGTPGYQLDIDTSGNNARLRVTGASSETVKWSAKVILVSENLSEQIVDLLPVRDNDSFLKFRNVANTADIDVLKVDTNNDTILNSDTGKIIEFANGGTTNWVVDGDAIIGQNSENVIKNNSLDGSDNKRVVIAGAGSSSVGRGAALYVHGNEHASFPGMAYIQAGSVAGAKIIFNMGGSDSFEFIDAGTTKTLVGKSTSGNFSSICTDGSDSVLQLNAGQTSVTNPHNSGAYVRLYSNANASPGTAQFFSGSGSGSVQIGTRGSGNLDFWSNNSLRWRLNGSNYHFLPVANGSYDLGQSGTRIRTVYAVNALNTSDERIKTNISSMDITDSLNKVLSLNPIRFDFIPAFGNLEPRASQRTGFKAQEANLHMPEAVIPGDNVAADMEDPGFELWSMQPDHIIPYLVAAIQKLSERLDSLENP